MQICNQEFKQRPEVPKNNITFHGFPNSSSASVRAFSASSHVSKTPRYFSGLYNTDIRRHKIKTFFFFSGKQDTVNSSISSRKWEMINLIYKNVFKNS
jgi:hypothetical protein